MQAAMADNTSFLVTEWGEKKKEKNLETLRRKDGSIKTENKLSKVAVSSTVPTHVFTIRYTWMKMPSSLLEQQKYEATTTKQNLSSFIKCGSIQIFTKLSWTVIENQK